MARLVDLTACGMGRLVNADAILFVEPANHGDESAGSDIQFAGHSELMTVDQSCSTIKKLVNGR